MKHNATNNKLLCYATIKLGLHKLLLNRNLQPSLRDDILRLDKQINSCRVTEQLNESNQAAENTIYRNKFVDIDIDRHIDNYIGRYINVAELKLNDKLVKPLADIFESLVGAIFLDSGNKFEPIYDLINTSGILNYYYS